MRGRRLSVACAAAAMGNQSSAHSHKTRKNVHWKSAGRPALPGKPDIIPLLTDDEPNAITLKWAPPAHDGGAPLRGYQVECNRLGSVDWVRTAPPIVLRPELLLTGLEPPHRYQFRVAAINAVGRSEYSELSDVLTVSTDNPIQQPPLFLQHLEDVIALENDKTEFRASFSGLPPPSIAWFKDDYEIFSSRRTAISTDESSSVLIFHQTLPSDEGEIKCTATNRAGHAVSRARLSLEAAPKLRYPRQYEDGLLYEINETVFLKTTIVGKPTPVIEWRHDGQPITVDERVQITNTSKFSMLKINAARRSDRGEYQVHARNIIGEDTAAFLVTITAPPDPPRNVRVNRQVDKSITLDWEPPEDDGGCRIGNYVIEYYRSGWNVWLKATTSRKTTVTLFDLIEGSQYRFRVKAESPYGMSAPSSESDTVKIPGRAVDMEFLAVESRIINEVLTKEEGQIPVSPAPRRKRLAASPAAAPVQEALSPVPLRKHKKVPTPNKATSNEFMLVLYPDAKKSDDKTEKRKSFQLDLEDALSPPPISLSAPELSSRCVVPFKALRNAVSSTELLHERAMARFYKAVALEEEQSKSKTLHQEPSKSQPNQTNHIPYTNIKITDRKDSNEKPKNNSIESIKSPEIFIKSDSMEAKEIKFLSNRQDSDVSDKWQNMSFDDDYTASTVSTDEDYSEEDSLAEDEARENILLEEEQTYNPRNKVTRPSPSPVQETMEIEEEYEPEDEPMKLSPLPDPNFVPKPILKKRDGDLEKDIELKLTKQEKYFPIKQKKADKVNILKKITKQKPFSFPKIGNKKENKNIEPVPKVSEDKCIGKDESTEDTISDEGKTVIDYYGNIVKEYGSHKKSSTPLYLNTEDLKQVAEQQVNKNIIPVQTVGTKKKVVKQVLRNQENSLKQKSKPNNIANKEKTKPQKTKQSIEIKDRKTNEIKEKSPVNLQHKIKKPAVKSVLDTQIVLKTTERATVVIPIDYKKLEERAKVNVRSAIDYTVDVCLLLLAFWVYFFKDERLAIPFLILIIYRQLQETIFQNIPEWINRHTPQWLKKKTS